MQARNEIAFPLIPYKVGSSPSRVEPLARFLPPILFGEVESWLSSTIPIHSRMGDPPWVLDPFGASPRVAIEAARAGYRVLVAANNPISRFLIEMAATRPSDEELQSALADLAATRRGDERLELHIRSLYTIHCSSCGNEVEVDAFLWERGEITPPAEFSASTETYPYAALYTCSNCGQDGEFALTEEDQVKAAQYSSIGLHRARALERVAAMDDPDRHHVEEALSIYTPRAVYALFTLVNRLDGMKLTRDQHSLLSAILLSAFDSANSLWSYPSGRARPRSLITPVRFRENNVWRALEQAIPVWARIAEKPLPCSTFPELPPIEGGICIFEGRLRDLADQLLEIPINAVVTALPRPNQAFWTLSALWSGWLWGREAVGPFKSVLRRRRYDWAWHTTALHSAFQSLSTKLNPGTPFFGLIGEVETGYLSAATIAAENAGFHLHQIAMPTDGARAQITWAREDPQTPNAISRTWRLSDAKNAAQELLALLSEPAHYLDLYAAVIQNQADNYSLKQAAVPPPELQSKLNTIVGEAISDQEVFQRLGGSDKSLEVGYWWLTQPQDLSMPLTDRIEMELVSYLIALPGSPRLQIFQHLCNTFPGLLTPSPELLQLCLESYATKSDPDNDGWSITPQNIPKVRKADIQQITETLERLATNLHFQQEGTNPVLWRGEGGNVTYAWYVIASAIISKPVFSKTYPSKISVVILPGGRANLVAYKIQRDPRLKQAVEDGWRFVKFRHIRWLAENPIGIKESFDPILEQDTPTYESPQLRLF